MRAKSKGNGVRALVLSALTGTAFVAFPSYASAQTGEPDAMPSSDDASSSGDIVVTARRREERAIDVPLSVSVESGESLRSKGVETAMDIGKLAPSLTVTPSPRGGNTPYFVIRGQRLIATSIAIDPVTIVYVNEVPYMRPNGLNGALFDIQNLQVLRGPQGTLFGRNTTGGAVLINTNQVSSDLEGNVALTTGSYDLFAARGALNIPLTDRFGIRVAGVFERRDGWSTNRLDGYKSNSDRYDGQRLTVDWEPIDGVKMVTYASRFHSSNSGSASQIYKAYPGFRFSAAQLPIVQQEIAANKADPRTFSSDQNLVETAKTWDVTNVLTIDLAPGIIAKNIASYRDVKTFSTFDLDSSSFLIGNQAGTTEVHQYSEEFQLQGTGTNFDWTAGLFYFREKGFDHSESIQAPTTTLIRVSEMQARNTSFSVFASGTYRFGLDGLSLSAGARYTWDKREGTVYRPQLNAATRAFVLCDFRLLNNTSPATAATCLYPQEAKFSEPSWSVSLNYKLNPEAMVYLAHRHGYRSGGVQLQPTSVAAAIPFQPEKVNDVELGLKLDIDRGDFAFRFNGDVYMAWYSDLQRQVSTISPINGNLIPVVINAATSRVSGVEVDATLVPVRGLELFGSFSYTHTKYRSFINQTAAGPADISYWPFAYIPKYTANGSISYTLPVDEKIGTIKGSFSVRYQSSYINFDVPANDVEIPGFAIADARLEWNEINETNLSLSLNVSNVFDKVYYPYSTNLSTSLGFNTRLIGAPRMFRLEGRYSF